MESFVVPDGMVGIAIVIAVIIGFLREIAWVAQRSRFLPYVSIGLGIASSYLLSRLQPPEMSPGDLLNQILQTGVMVGLLACGGYDALKIPLERIRNKPTAPMLLLALLLLPACTGLTARDELLLPAMQPVWAGLQEEAPIDETVAGSLTMALDAGDKEGITLYWAQAKPLIDAKIYERLAAGEISEALAVTLRREAAELDADIIVFCRR